MNQEEAQSILDNAIFGSHVFNMQYPDDVLITFEGDNFVVASYETGEVHHFRCAVEPHTWDSTQALKDREWDG